VSTLILLSIVLCACRKDAHVPVEIDLTRLALCSVAGKVAAVPVAIEGNYPRLLQPDARPIDFFLRLPSKSELFFDFAHEISLEAVRVSVTSDERADVLSPARHQQGAWRAGMQAFDGKVVRLRFENLSKGPLAWGRPRVVGVGELLEPALPQSPEAEVARPNIVLYVVDALRADHLSVYGYERRTSPHLEKLARRSSLFLNAYSTGADTAGSLPGLFTSLYPAEAQGRLRPAKNAAKHTLAEVFREAGYSTAAFLANTTMKSSLGYARGFDTYEIDGGLVIAEKLHARVLEWLNVSRTKPFFLYVQSMDVHHPYELPPSFSGRFSQNENRTPPELTYLPPGLIEKQRSFWRTMVRSLRPHQYDDAVAYADHELGKLIATLGDRGLRDSTVIVITADHGESLGEGGRYYHGLSLHEEQVHIPLIVSLPWLRAQAREDALVSLVDLGPTLLDIAGIPVPSEFKGRSLLRGYERHKPRAVFGVRRFFRPAAYEWFAREGPWKLHVIGSDARLIHIPSDREESNDKSEEMPITKGFLTHLKWGSIWEYRDRIHEVQRLDAGLDEKERNELNEALRALGYIE
jgi:arylsulfatase